MSKIIEFPAQRRGDYDKHDIIDEKGQTAGFFSLKMESKPSWQRPECIYCNQICDTHLVVYYGKKKGNISLSCCGKEKCMKLAQKQAKDMVPRHK